MYGLRNVIHRLGSALNQLKLENPGRRFPILINLIKSKQIPMPGRTWRSPVMSGRAWPARGDLQSGRTPACSLRPPAQKSVPLYPVLESGSESELLSSQWPGLQPYTCQTTTTHRSFTAEKKQVFNWGSNRWINLLSDHFSPAYRPCSRPVIQYSHPDYFQVANPRANLTFVVKWKDWKMKKKTKKTPHSASGNHEA